MSTHNICFRGEIRKIFTGYPPLSRPMLLMFLQCGTRTRDRLTILTSGPGLPKMNI